MRLSPPSMGGPRFPAFSVGVGGRSRDVARRLLAKYKLAQLRGIGSSMRATSPEDPSMPLLRPPARSLPTCLASISVPVLPSSSCSGHRLLGGPVAVPSPPPPSPLHHHQHTDAREQMPILFLHPVPSHPIPSHPMLMASGKLSAMEYLRPSKPYLASTRRPHGAEHIVVAAPNCA